MITKLLVEIKEIESKIEAMESEKQELRKKVIAVMTEKGSALEIIDLPIGKFKMVKKQVANVTYSEEILKQRLGNKYKLVLDLDAKQLRDHKVEVLQALGDKILDVGVISQNRVKAAVASGELAAGDFKGAFEKAVVDRLVITRIP